MSSRYSFLPLLTQDTLLELKNTNGAITKILPGSADAKLLIRRQMITLVYSLLLPNHPQHA